MPFSQNPIPNVSSSQQGKLYFYWGWNRAWYGKSNINFKGENYTFELKKVVAKDRQTPFALDPYFHPEKFTIPQYNFRLGYFLKDNWNISFGVDHMKYVMKTDQVVSISGYINETASLFNDTYQNDSISLSPDFLKFEHTDGLNYINLELRRFDNLLIWKNTTVNLTEGMGAGVLIPKTNTTLMGKDRYDEFHLSGFGLGAILGLNVSFFDLLFVQTELKGGYINMPSVRTTKFRSDKANHAFFYLQTNLLFGVNISLKGK